jgi:hypothetical protein
MDIHHGCRPCRALPRILVTFAWTVHWRQGLIHSVVCGEGGTWECNHHGLLPPIQYPISTTTRQQQGDDEQNGPRELLELEAWSMVSFPRPLCCSLDHVRAGIISQRFCTASS